MWVFCQKEKNLSMNPVWLIKLLFPQLYKYKRTTINPASSLLFLDEIQAAPELFSKLRWFKEDMEQLPVIAAGSLLEFSLNKYQYSMPVGRITYFYLEPMSFFEFILAAGNDTFYEKLLTFNPEKRMPESLHEKCLSLYYDFCLVGGMPEESFQAIPLA